MVSKKRNTLLVNAGRKKKYCHGAVNSVVQKASSLVFETMAEKKQATQQKGERTLFYGRRGTLTHFSFQDAMCELEGGAGCVLYPCGAAAISNAILAFVKTKDDILMTAGAYEPTQGFCEHILKDFGITTRYYDPMIGADIAKMILPETKIIFLESPSSITMEVPDVPAIVKAARQVNPDIIIMIDNTWSAGVLFPALSHDIDVSIQSGTKYIIGHSDAMIGTAVSNARCFEQLRERSYLMGQMVDADIAYMASRGLRTLNVRLQQHHQSSIEVAQWLEKQELVAQVNHPALPSSVGHAFYQRDFSGSCGLFSFVLKERLDQTRLANFIDNFEHFKMAFSWGGFESLILPTQPEELKKMRPVGGVNFKGTLIRLHIGLEDVSDLIADLEKGFQRI